MSAKPLEWDALEFSGEGLVQQRLLQRLQRGELPLVEAGEALGFGFVHGQSFPTPSRFRREFMDRLFADGPLAQKLVLHRAEIDLLQVELLDLPVVHCVEIEHAILEV